MISQIDTAITHADRIVAGVTPEDLDAATPCSAWDVRALLNHLVGGMRIFAAELTGTGPVGEHESDWLGADPQAAFETAARLDRQAWQRPDALAATVHISLGALPGHVAASVHLTELVVHAVDLAVATEQETLVSEELCAEQLRLMRSAGIDAYRVPGVFGAEVAVAPDAPAHLQLLAYLGRAL
ncbi:TIGR03086 family protein [Catellatospora sp. TT07R-123]|uniref:TIGR03086 family metal-binding protein n=1 Tax=Catellatospora sp. TT07R-123 TaxID=2733863 RepID=UPI001B16EAC2|nr:TIGR03086 family metal-binding protein [Catellatospora sp. TT07R-123]GHJ48342.1 TIGR03086 family protein [Catellatospora sp. TT07R-123]